MRTIATRQRLLSMAAALLAAAGGTASAAAVSYGTPATGQITLDASYSMPQAGTPADGMASPPATIYQNLGSTGADMYLYESAGANNVFFHTYGFVGNTTYFGARASGQGSFDAFTSVLYSQVFTNETATAQRYTFDFFVSEGEVAVTGVGTGLAELLLNVSKTTGAGTTVLASSNTQVNRSSTDPAACSSSGIGALASYIGCNSGYGYGYGRTITVDLGLLAPGDSFTLSYEIMSRVSGDLTSGDEGYSMGFVPCGRPVEVAHRAAARNAKVSDEVDVCAVEGWFTGEAIARSGDPFNGPQFGTGGPSDWQMAGLNVTATAAGDVPEPGSLALAGVALTTLAAIRRRRSAKAG